MPYAPGSRRMIVPGPAARRIAWAVAVTVAVVACVLAVTAWAAPHASANDGILYGPGDAIVIGGVPAPVPVDPSYPDGKLAPDPFVRGYCIPWSILSAFHIGSGSTITRSSDQPRHAYVELTDGIRCGRSVGGNPMNPGLVLMPRVGYTFEAATAPTHLGRVGLGIGYGHARATIMYAPHLVFGNADGIRTGGFRHGLLLSLGSDLFTVEMAHQVLVTEGRMTSDVRVSASLNLLIVAYALAR